MKWRLIAGALALVGALAILYVVVPAIAGLDDTWRRISAGDGGWLLLGLGLEVLSFASYVVYFRTSFIDWPGLSWRSSYRITMAGVVATRLLAVAGAGGIALMAWGLRRLGMPRRSVAVGMTTFYLLLYALFMVALVILGAALRLGVGADIQPLPLTVIPAALGLAAIGVTLGLAAWGGNAQHPGRLGSWTATLAAAVDRGIDLLRSHRVGLLGAIGWWAFDIAVLWCSLRAFGVAPPVAIVVMAYFVGMLANTLPVPGGIGAVDGGIFGALVAFGVEAGPALVAVLSYRAFSFWLPILPGLVAYLQLLAEEPVPTTGGQTVDRADDHVRNDGDASVDEPRQHALR